MISQLAPVRPALNDYPNSDGKPMAENDFHRALMLQLIDTLEWWYRTRTDVYVTGNLLLFYHRGDRRKHLSPDVFVVRGVPNHRRMNYLMWEEKPPEVVIELTSKTTRRADLGRKWKLYETVLGVKEYFLFDPLEDYLTPSFQGVRRGVAGFEPIEFVDGRLKSLVLELELERVGTELRFHNPATGQQLPTFEEREAEARLLAVAAQERERSERLRADRERIRADREQMRADRAVLAQEAALREIDRLKRELENRG